MICASSSNRLVDLPIKREAGAEHGCLDSDRSRLCQCNAIDYTRITGWSAIVCAVMNYTRSAVSTVICTIVCPSGFHIAAHIAQRAVTSPGRPLSLELRPLLCDQLNVSLHVVERCIPRAFSSRRQTSTIDMYANSRNSVSVHRVDHT